MRVELGINTCFAVKRWPRPGDWAPIVRDRLGLTVVQHSLDLVDLDSGPERALQQAHEVRDVAVEAGLTIHSTFTGLAAYSSNMLLHPDGEERARARRWYERAIAFTSAVGGLGTGGHVGAFSVPDWHDAHRRGMLWAELRSTLGELAALAHRAGQRWFLVENLAAAREPSTIAMCRELVTDGSPEQVPVRLCLDVGHQCVPGTEGDDRDPYAWLRALGRVAPVVQLQQSDAQGDHHWPFTPERNRAGRIDADRVLDALEEGATEETALILEVIPAFEEDDGAVIDALVASVDYWREALARRGSPRLPSRA